MKSKDLKPLKVSLHGMNERMHKMMVNYLKLPCKGIAIVVDDDEALAEIVDVDLSLSKSLLEERLAQQPSKPIIALSLNEISTSGVIYVKKPIEVPDVLAAFAVAKDVILGKTSLEITAKPQPETTKGAAGVITQALQKSEATGKLSDQQDYLRDILHKEIALDDTKPQPEKAVEKKQAPSKTGKSSTTQPKSEPAKDKSEITQLNLKTKFSKKKKKTSSPKKTGPHKVKTVAFNEQKTATQDEIVQPASTPEFLKHHDDISVKSTPIDESEEIKKHLEKTTQAWSKSEIKPSLDQSVTLKEPTVEQTISTNEASIAKPDKDQQQTKEKTKPILTGKFTTAESFSSFLDILWHRKSLITGLTCLFTLIAGIYIFQITPMYETRARIFISPDNAKNSDVNSTSAEDTLDKTIAQKKINDIASRQLAGRVINILKLNTIPEFFAASVSPDAQASTSKLRLERQAAEQISNITDYFLQNLNVVQFKNSPIINIDYRAEDPGLATKIVNQLTEEYLVLQEEKKTEIEQQLIDWETNKLPAARDQVEQSQNALELYVEMNKWSQFEQQFAEDMGVNSEIRALEKKLKADIALYEILVERFENFKQDIDSMEAKLISSAELPLSPSYPNKLRLLLSTLLSAALIAILITYILSVLNYGGKKVIGEPI